VSLALAGTVLVVLFVLALGSKPSGLKA